MKFFLFLLGFLAVIIYSGCSSSSNSTRYGNSSKDKSGKTEDVRFTSDNDNNTKDSIEQNDTETENITNIDDPDVDDLPDNETKIDISSVIKKISPSSNSNDLSFKNGTPKEKMLMEIIRYLNTPYKYGGTSKNGIDCSAFTQAVYNKALSFKLERTASQQFREGESVSDVDNLQFGDLVFFNTSRRVKPGHVGIYIGDHLFAHASKSGVTVSSLDMEYYSNRFMGGRRVESDQFGSK
ncbi:MAG TPA: C40 family peptidase [Ignavibacteriaceae bacterium]|nr:C40 family peptidase [Ignavibacteriaceae bacterium]